MASKVGKIIKFILLAIVIIIIAIVVVLKIWGGKLMTTAAETAGTKALNVAVNIDGIAIQPFSGSGGINGLSIANPAGYNNPYLMQMKDGQVKVNIKSLFSDTVVIEKVHLEDLHITFEQKGLSSNVQQIIKGLEDSSSKPDPKTEPAKEGKQKNVVVSDLQITGAKVSVKLLPIPGKADTLTISLPDIKMTDVGKGEKMEFADIIELVFIKISEAIAGAGKGVIPEDLLGSLNSSIDGAVKVIGSAGEQILQTGSGILEGGADAGRAITESASKTLEGIGNIFGGKKEDAAKE